MGGGFSQIGSSNDVSMVNQQGFNDVNAQIQSMLNSGNQNNPYMSQAASAFGQMQGLSDNYNNYIAKLFGTGGISSQLAEASRGYDPNAGFNLFQNRQPEFQRMAEAMTENALSGAGDTARSLAQRTANQGMNNTASQLAEAGILGSGAGVGAITEAAVNPMLAAENQLAQTRAGYLGNLNQAMTLGGMQQFQNSYDMQRQQLIQGILGQAGLAESGAGMLGNQLNALGAVGSGYGNLANLFGSQQAGLLGNLAQLNMPEYWQPQYQKDRDWWDYITGGVGMGTSIASLAMGMPSTYQAPSSSNH